MTVEIPELPREIWEKIMIHIAIKERQEYFALQLALGNQEEEITWPFFDDEHAAMLAGDVLNPVTR